jgi:hypothetical protein
VSLRYGKGPEADIDLDQKLSDQDRLYLWNRDWLRPIVVENDERFGPGGPDEQETP